jgi:hypothetical protein
MAEDRQMTESDKRTLEFNPASLDKSNWKNSQKVETESESAV